MKKKEETAFTSLWLSRNLVLDLIEPKTIVFLRKEVSLTPIPGWFEFAFVDPEKKKPEEVRGE